jgi:cytochrome c-type biogenesis protein CcmH
MIKAIVVKNPLFQLAALVIAATLGNLALFLFLTPGPTVPAPAGRPSVPAPAPQAVSGERPSPAEIAARVGDLERRLRETPNDFDGWKMLGRSYMALARYSEATGAYAKAQTLRANDAEVNGALQRLQEIAAERARSGG